MDYFAVCFVLVGWIPGMRQRLEEGFALSVCAEINVLKLCWRINGKWQVNLYYVCTYYCL